jgi:hypothetical protein
MEERSFSVEVSWWKLLECLLKEQMVAGAVFTGSCSRIRRSIVCVGRSNIMSENEIWSRRTPFKSWTMTKTAERIK